MGFRLIELSTNLAVCRLDPADALPVIPESEFFSVTRTADELSIVCAESHAPGNATIESGFRAFRVDGVLDFALIGILSELTKVLADAGISVFAISTYDTDYLLLKASSMPKAREVLRAAGHRPD